MALNLPAPRAGYRCLSPLLVLCMCLADPGFSQTARDSTEQPSAAVGGTELYRLAPGDVISIRFFHNPELNEEVQIRPDGQISMQLVGELAAAGKTAGAFAKELEARYATEIKMPRITIQIRSYGGEKVYITGEVQRPGVVSLVGGLSVLGAIGESGGVRQAGKTNSVILIRRGPDGKPTARTLALGSLTKPLPDAGLALQPLDVLIVPPRTIAKIDRWVDEYIRQLIPANLGAGFQYLYNRTASSVSVVPF